jgi:hypothetical protein
MSDGERIGNAANIPASEQPTSIHPFTREDPTVRAAYSSNPGFVDGANIVYTAAVTALAQPEVAEALEHLYRKKHEKARRDGEPPVQTELAVPGLAWLREHLDRDAPIMRTVKREYRTLEPQETRRREMEERRQEAAARDRAEREAKQTAAEAQRAHEAECEEQFGSVLAATGSRYPELDFGHVVELAGRLLSHQKPDGGVAVDQTNAFQKALKSRVGMHMADPQTLVTDFRAINGMQFVAEEVLEGRTDTVAPRLQEIGLALSAELDTRTYDDFSEADMDAWLAIFSHNPSEVINSPAKLPADEDLPKHPVSFSATIVHRSLVAIANRDPRKFITRMYAFANKGLETDHSTQFQFTCDILMACLQRPFAYQQLLRATSAALILEGAKDDPFFDQAVDLSATLEAVGVFHQLPKTNDAMLEHLSDDQCRLLDEICPRDFLVAARHTAPTEEARGRLLKSTMGDFRERALTSEGRSTTLYGMLASQGRIIPQQQNA